MTCRTETVINRDGQEEKQVSFNSIYMMADSGGVVLRHRFVSLLIVRGLMAKPDALDHQNANHRELP
ncbi:hypothetical protein ACLK14_22345 [Escherichia coli]